MGDSKSTVPNIVVPMQEPNVANLCHHTMLAASTLGRFQYPTSVVALLDTVPMMCCPPTSFLPQLQNSRPPSVTHAHTHMQQQRQYWSGEYNVKADVGDKIMRSEITKASRSDAAMFIDWVHQFHTLWYHPLLTVQRTGASHVICGHDA